MKLNKFLSSIMLLLVLVLCTGCDPDEDPYLDINETELVFESKGGTKSFKISSNVEWNISGMENWVTVTPQQGSDNKTINVTVENYTVSSSSRECTLEITGDDNTFQTITIKQTEAEGILTVDNNNLIFSSKVNDDKTINIKSNSRWFIEASSIPKWLRASSTSGNGDTQVTFTTILENKTSDENEAIIVISTDNASVNINVRQDCGVAKNCKVTPNHITVLSEGIAFDMTFEKDVVRYYRGYIEASSVGLMSDDEIIETLETNFDRHLVNENEVPNFSDLDSGRKYIIYTLGYNASGERGDLVGTPVTTSREIANEPMAWIGDVTSDNSYWYWDVKKSATCYTYYMMSSQNIDDAAASDVLQAWWIDEAIRNSNITEYVNGGDWYAPKKNWLCAVWTRGKDARGNWSNTIDYDAGFSFDASSKTNKAQILKKKNVKGDNSGHKLSPGQYKLFLMK